MQFVKCLHAHNTRNGTKTKALRKGGKSGQAKKRPKKSQNKTRLKKSQNQRRKPEKRLTNQNRRQSRATRKKSRKPRRPSLHPKASKQSQRLKERRQSPRPKAKQQSLSPKGKKPKHRKVNKRNLRQRKQKMPSVCLCIVLCICETNLVGNLTFKIGKIGKDLQAWIYSRELRNIFLIFSSSITLCLTPFNTIERQVSPAGRCSGNLALAAVLASVTE